MPAFEHAVELGLVGAHVGQRHGVHVAVGGGVDDRDLALDRQRLVLRLLQNLDEARAAGELLLRRLFRGRYRALQRMPQLATAAPGPAGACPPPGASP